ncbi:MAG: hypothetical protein E7460_04225 [Ruminococcaceae bacterium]|nr:hypothetical protein [Oscillospiraceae bacterium]
MKKTAAIAMVVGGALALVGSLLFLTAMFMMKFDFDNLSIPNESPTETVQEFSGDIHSLRIEDSTADVTLAPYDGETVSVTYVAGRKEFYSFICDGGVLTVQKYNTRAWYDYISFGSEKTYLFILLPRKDYNELFLSTGTGDFYVESGLCFNAITASASTGDIDLNANVLSSVYITTTTGSATVSGISGGETAPTLSIVTSTGNISLSGLELSGADVKTDTGRTRINGLTVSGAGSTVITTDTGDVSANTVNVNSLNVTTDTGDVSANTVNVNSLNVTTDTGDVSFENTYAPFTGMETDTGDIELNFFYAEEMDIKTFSGDVSGILQSQMTVIPETSTGSINIHHDVYGGKGTCRVTTSSGDISIRLSLEPR